MLRRKFTRFPLGNLLFENYSGRENGLGTLYRDNISKYIGRSRTGFGHNPRAGSVDYLEDWLARQNSVDF